MFYLTFNTYNLVEIGIIYQVSRRKVNDIFVYAQLNIYLFKLQQFLINTTQPQSNFLLTYLRKISRNSKYIETAVLLNKEKAFIYIFNNEILIMKI